MNYPAWQIKTADPAAEQDIEIFHTGDVNARRIGRAGIFTNRAEVEAFARVQDVYAHQNA